MSGQTVEILVRDKGSFLDKYILRELQDNPLHPDQRVHHGNQEDMSPRWIFEADDQSITITDTSSRRKVVITGHNIVGTGMTGKMREMTVAIYRGQYMHIEGNQARVSVVHAVDMARAACHAAIDDSLSGSYVLTDGSDPTRHDLAEALAHRLDQKRIFTLSPKRAKRLARIGDFIPFLPLNTPSLRLMTSDDVADSSAWRSAVPGWTATSVVDYLTTHNYDEGSL